MKILIIGLITDIISAHPIYPVGSMTDTVYLNPENPTVELSEADANLVLTGSNGNVFQVVGETDSPDLTKAQLQALFLQTIGTAPSNRLNVDALKAAIDEFNKEVDNAAASSSAGLSTASLTPVVPAPVIAETASAPVPVVSVVTTTTVQ